jgi:hypothetical protein
MHLTKLDPNRTLTPWHRKIIKLIKSGKVVMGVIEKEKKLDKPK